MAKFSYAQFYRICYEEKRNLAWKKVHDMYLLTDLWQDDFRPKVLERDGYICRLCGDPADDVHHIPKFYPKIFGQEKLIHLTSLCRPCHTNFHFPPGIEEAKQQLMKTKDDKMIKCPCCDQQVKLYRRPLNSTMAYGLILVARYFEKSDAEEWLHVESYFKTRDGAPPSLRGDFAKLRYWDLVEIKSGTSGASRQGLYRITDKGKEFVSNRLSLPRKVFIYNKKVVGFSDEKTTIAQALGDQFNYALL